MPTSRYPAPLTRPMVHLHAFLTLDGFVADPSLPSFDQAWSQACQESCSQYMLGLSDTLLLGRKTYESIVVDSPWPYTEHQAYIISTNKVDLPALASGLNVSDQSLERTLLSLHQHGCRHVWLMGGRRLVIGALQAQVIDELVVHLLPFAQGQGQQFFDQPNLPDLNLADVMRLEHGVVRMHYQVNYDG